MKHLRSFAAAGLFVALGALSFGAPAFAQDDDDIVVTAPYSVHVERDRAGYGRTVTVSEEVSAQGLDLRYDSDVDELQSRIAYTAHEVCDRASDYLDGPSDTTDHECVRDAIRGAQPQARYLIRRARS